MREKYEGQKRRGKKERMRGRKRFGE